MAYGVKWRLEFTDELGRDKRADILKKDYTGAITQVTGAGFSPLFTSIQNQGDPKYETVRGTEIELRVYAELQSGPIDYTLSNDTIYYVKQSSGDIILIKGTYDTTNGITSFSETAINGDNSVTIVDDDADSTMLYILSNGSVLWYNYDTDGDYSTALFDSDLNLLGSLSGTPTSSVIQSQRQATVDENDNLYICIPTSSNNFVVKKYTDQFDLVWTSSSISPGRCFQIVSGVDQVLITHTGAPPSADSVMTSLNKSDGSVKNTSTVFNNVQYPRFDRSSLCYLPDDKFFATLKDGGTGVDGQYIIYGKIDLSDYELIDASAIGGSYNSLSSTGNFDQATSTKAGKVLQLVTISSDLYQIDIVNQSLDWVMDVSSLNGGDPRTFSTRQDEGIIIGCGSGSDTGGLGVIDSETQTILANIATGGSGTGSQSRSHKSIFDNWQLREFGNFETDVDFSEIITGTDTDYKIEIYEEAAAS